jgi:hypothetical protein
MLKMKSGHTNLSFGLKTMNKTMVTIAVMAGRITPETVLRNLEFFAMGVVFVFDANLIFF